LFLLARGQPEALPKRESPNVTMRAEILSIVPHNITIAVVRQKDFLYLR